MRPLLRPADVLPVLAVAVAAAVGTGPQRLVAAVLLAVVVARAVARRRARIPGHGVPRTHGREALVTPEGDGCERPTPVTLIGHHSA